MTSPEKKATRVFPVTFGEPVKPVTVGIIGCGAISGIYFETARDFPILRLVGCADMVMERARERAQEFETRAYTVDELLADAEVELIINLTIPAAHAEVARRALEAGKHVYSEKPLAISREDGRQELELARAKGLLVGNAPDTFLGAGIQTCRKLIDDGWIGTPVAASAFMLGHGVETWHANPEFYYKRGGGPMFDMGPYYLTALVNLLGPMRRVTGSTRVTFPQRFVTSMPFRGKVIEVETPTHVTGVIDFASGAVATMTMSFDVWSHNLPPIEIYGTEGSLRAPDPNTFGGPVRVRRAGAEEWSEAPLAFGYAKNSRGVGVADMAYAIRYERAQRASGEMAYHVLDAMSAFEEASVTGRHVELTSTCERPAAFPLGLRERELDGAR